ncbi:MAG: preprotein translocase subunit SecG [Planctomycetes bacterium HGW-Planctomycetes-1]|nr:MAG: preprotein translocase subunit SecG [Planctomycetes bacterium HGW-Planctomycetes-1]
MMDFAVAAVPFVMKVVVGIWAVIGVVLVLLVLIQKGRGGGLSSAFGGLGSSLLGTKTGDFLTWVTISLVAVWLVLSVVAAKWFKPQTSEFLQSRPIPSAPAAAPVQPQVPLAEQQQAPVIAQPNTPAN